MHGSMFVSLDCHWLHPNLHTFHPQDGTIAASTDLLAPREGPTNSWAAVPKLEKISDPKHKPVRTYVHHWCAYKWRLDVTFFAVFFLVVVVAYFGHLGWWTDGPRFAVWIHLIQMLTSCGEMFSTGPDRVHGGCPSKVSLASSRSFKMVLDQAFVKDGFCNMSIHSKHVHCTCVVCGVKYFNIWLVNISWPARWGGLCHILRKGIWTVSG